MPPGELVTKFHDLLRELSIDVGEYKSFDVLHETQLNSFILWLCDNLNKDNHLSSDEEASYQTLISETEDFEDRNSVFPVSESIAVDASDILLEVKKSLDCRLVQSEAHLCQLRHIEKKRSAEEKSLIAKYNEASDNLAKKVAQNLTDSIIVSTEVALKTCCAIDPVLPDLDLCKQSEEETYKLLSSYQKDCISDFEITRQNELDSISTDMTDLENILTVAVCNRKSAQRNVANNLRGHPTQRLNPSSLIVGEKVGKACANHLRRRSVLLLKRELAAYDYVIPSYEAYYDFLARYLGSAQALAAALSERHFTFNSMATTRNDFIDKLTWEMKSVAEKVGLFKEIKDTDTVDSSLTVPENNKMVRKPPSQLAQLLLEPSQRDALMWERLSNIITMWLTELRCGPTLSLQILPMDSVLLLNKCQRSETLIRKNLKHLAGLCVALMDTVKSKWNWDQKLHWAYFLCEPQKLRSLALPSSNPTASSTMIADHSMLDFSKISDFNFK